jgi:hypothetical protein
MPLASNLKFSCATMPNANGHKIKGLTPDENGYYDVVLGCVGAPTRANVIYQPDSLISAMADPDSRFNICLKDGNLFGEWGHPVIKSNKDMDRLLQIDEHYISHQFGKIWVDEKPIVLHGIEGYPIRALVKPCGPYGDVLKRSLEDATINTAFSIRSLCMPDTGPNREYEYRRVQIVVTFDAVNAPGFEMATKRYNSVGMESFTERSVGFETEATRDELEAAINSHAGMESSLMITDRDIKKFFNEKDYYFGNKIVGTSITGKTSLLKADNNIGSAAALMYRRK